MLAPSLHALPAHSLLYPRPDVAFSLLCGWVKEMAVFLQRSREGPRFPHDGTAQYLNSLRKSLHTVKGLSGNIFIGNGLEGVALLLEKTVKNLLRRTAANDEARRTALTSDVELCEQFLLLQGVLNARIEIVQEWHAAMAAEFGAQGHDMGSELPSSVLPESAFASRQQLGQDERFERMWCRGAGSSAAGDTAAADGKGGACGCQGSAETTVAATATKTPGTPLTVRAPKVWATADAAAAGAWAVGGDGGDGDGGGGGGGVAESGEQDHIGANPWLS